VFSGLACLLRALASHGSCRLALSRRPALLRTLEGVARLLGLRIAAERKYLRKLEADKVRAGWKGRACSGVESWCGMAWFCCTAHGHWPRVGFAPARVCRASFAQP
jgi:hypothetical protein